MMCSEFVELRKPPEGRNDFTERPEGSCPSVTHFNTLSGTGCFPQNNPHPVVHYCRKFSAEATTVLARQLLFIDMSYYALR